MTSGGRLAATPPAVSRPPARRPVVADADRLPVEPQEPPNASRPRPPQNRRTRRRGRGHRGQATVELALGLPIVVLGALLVLQFSIVAVGQLRAVHAAREGARAASTGADRGTIDRAVVRSSGLDRNDILVDVRPRGTDVEVGVELRIATDLPLIGPLVPDVTVGARAVMRREN